MAQPLIRGDKAVDLVVRRATDADLNSWAEMLARLHRGPSAAEFERELRMLTRLPEPYAGYLAFSNSGEPVGMIDARVRNYAEGAPDLRAAYVEDLWVEPEARRNGVARVLLGAVETWAREQGLSWLGSDTTPDNRASRSWHEAAGFAQVEQIVVFGKPLD